MATKRITFSLPDDLVRHAKFLASREGTPVSALVADLLRRAAADRRGYDSIWAQEERLIAEAIGKKVGPTTPARTELHDRKG